MLKQKWLSFTMAALLAGAMGGCMGDEGGGGGGDDRDTGAYSDDNRGRMDGTMDTRDDEDDRHNRDRVGPYKAD